jgi:class 3 adenylate cyclase
MASVLFTDIVGFSRNPLEKQSDLLDSLQQIVRETQEYRRAEQAGSLIKLPTGDGMALVFFHDPVAPVRCALEIQNALKSHPELPLRTGVHTGPIYRQSDIKDNINVVGGGINLAQRVMDCGDAGHILLSRAVADVLEQLNDWPDYLKDLGFVEVKHGLQIQIFNIVRDGVGNPEIPSKLKALHRAASGSRKRLLPVWIGLGLLAIAAGTWLALRPTPAQTTLATSVPGAGATKRTLDYHVMLQKFRDDKPFGAAKQLPGEAGEIESGNGFHLVISAEEPGHLYVLHETLESKSAKPDFHIFFPSPKVRNGSSRLLKDDEIQIPESNDAYLKFDSQTGTEKTWIVWSLEQVPELEPLKEFATDKYVGVIDAAKATTLPQLLGKFQPEKLPETDSENKLTRLRSSSDVLVHFIKWEHY